ncbi:MAG TPA: DUF488 domain-containing protein [Trueperaceae bacterium]|nr:DUF488 domain-containing protein [Trueperaceae bacterium]
MADTTIYTIGHSTRSLDEFVAMLKAHGVTSLIDIRTIPKSRRHPHFAGETLAESLPDAGVSYDWMEALGGLRKPKPDSENSAWRNLSFRGYADHMQTEAFNAAVDELVRRSQDASVAIMCSEAVPWRCHRSLVGDALLARGVKVLDIMSDTKATPYELTSFALVDGTRVTYPREASDGSQS